MNINKYIMVLVSVIAILGLTGCNGKKAAINVVSKTYDVTCQIERYVDAADATNLVENLKSLRNPINTVVYALEFITPYIKTTKIVQNIDLLVKNLRVIVSQIDTMNENNVFEWKGLILEQAVEVRTTLGTIGRYLGLGLDCGAIKGRVLISDLIFSSGELNEYINSQK